MSMLSNLDLIRRVPLFSMLTNDQAQSIADSVVKRRFRRGEIVVEHGKKSNALFILLTGRARVLTSDSRGREDDLATTRVGGQHAGTAGQQDEQGIRLLVVLHHDLAAPETPLDDAVGDALGLVVGQQ